MNKEYGGTGLGEISVDNEVIKNIALKAATEIEGIHELGRGRHLTKIWNTLTKKSPTRGIKLEFTDASELNITLKLLVEYGTNIPYTAGAVQERVKKSIEHMTGLTVAEVAVKIIGMCAMYGKKEEQKEDLEKEV